jgi:cytochrome c oxidase cbb3-type subunit 3
VPAGNVAEGSKLFATNCIACHGADGKGNQAIGAPDLTDHTWLYGGSVDAVRASIANGRQGHMPAQVERLGAQRVKLLAAYVLSLGAGADSDIATH